MTTIEQKRIDFLTEKYAGDERYSAEKIEFLVRTGMTFDPSKTRKLFNGEEKAYKDIDWYYPKGAAFKTEESGEDTPGGDTPGGDTPGGDTPGGDTPGGDTPGGDDNENPTEGDTQDAINDMLDSDEDGADFVDSDGTTSPVTEGSTVSVTTDENNQPLTDKDDAIISDGVEG